MSDHLANKRTAARTLALFLEFELRKAEPDPDRIGGFAGRVFRLREETGQ